MKSKTPIIYRSRLLSMMAATLLFLVVPAQSCNEPVMAADGTYARELVATALGTSGYTIGIPQGYSLSEQNGPDFTLYYLFPDDHDQVEGLMFVLYMGDYPSAGEESDDCVHDHVKGKLLGEKVRWERQVCNGKTQVQVIVDLEGGYSHPSKLHASGAASSEAEFRKLMTIFGTLRKTEL